MTIFTDVWLPMPPLTRAQAEQAGYTVLSDRIVCAYKYRRVGGYVLYSQQLPPPEVATAERQLCPLDYHDHSA